MIYERFPGSDLVMYVDLVLYGSYALGNVLLYYLTDSQHLYKPMQLQLSSV